MHHVTSTYLESFLSQGSSQTINNVCTLKVFKVDT